MEIKVIDKRLEEQFQALEKLFKEAEIEKNNLKKAQDTYTELTKNLKKLEDNYNAAIKELENKTKVCNEVIDGGLKLIDSKLGKITADVADISGRFSTLNKSNNALKKELHDHIEYFKMSPLKRWAAKKEK